MKPRCVRPNCRKRVKYIAPALLCSKHWKLWWWYGVKGKPDPWWIRRFVEPLPWTTVTSLKEVKEWFDKLPRTTRI